MAADILAVRGAPLGFAWSAARPSALRPGQAALLPAVDFVAVAGRLVEVPLEAFEHVVATAAPGFAARGGGAMRAVAAATDEEQQRFGIGGVGELGQEMRVEHPAWPRLPFDVHCSGDDAVELALGVRTHVDQARARRELQQLVRLVREQCPGKRPGICLTAAVGGVEQRGDASHGGFPYRLIQYMKPLVWRNALQWCVRPKHARKWCIAGGRRRTILSHPPCGTMPRVRFLTWHGCC